jgi:hypothetical protein
MTPTDWHTLGATLSFLTAGQLRDHLNALLRAVTDSEWAALEAGRSGGTA